MDTFTSSDGITREIGHDYLPPTLERAARLWEQDKPIPMTLAVELMEFGYDVRRLEREYRCSPAHRRAPMRVQ